MERDESASGKQPASENVSSESKPLASEDESENRADAQPAERKKPEYRSYVPKNQKSQPAMEQIKEEDKVIFSLSEKQSPIWTVNQVDYDKATKKYKYQLRKADDSLHDEWVGRERLALQESKKQESKK